MTHVFATCTSGPVNPGACYYQTYVEQLPCSTITGGLATATTYTVQISAEASPKLYWTGMVNGGKYIGSYFNITAANVSNTASTNNFYVTAATVYVRARNVDQDGEKGPARVARWDGLSSGQNVRCDAVFHAQCIPEGSIAPFVQKDAMYSNSGIDLNQFPFLSEMFNGPTPIRRVWVANEYENFLKQTPGVTAERILDWLPEGTKGYAIAEAAGVFDVLKRGLGVGLRLAAPYAQQGMEYAASQLGASGQFGRGAHACGEFGASGQFGACDTGKKRIRLVEEQY